MLQQQGLEHNKEQIWIKKGPKMPWKKITCALWMHKLLCIIKMRYFFCIQNQQIVTPFITFNSSEKPYSLSQINRNAAFFIFTILQFIFSLHHNLIDFDYFRSKLRVKIRQKMLNYVFIWWWDAWPVKPISCVTLT